MRARPTSRSAWILVISMSRFARSEEHTSELQSRSDLVCRLLLEKKNNAYCNGPRPREDGDVDLPLAYILLHDAIGDRLDRGVRLCLYHLLQHGDTALIRARHRQH